MSAEPYLRRLPANLAALLRDAPSGVLRDFAEQCVSRSAQELGAEGELSHLAQVADGLDMVALHIQEAAERGDATQKEYMAAFARARLAAAAAALGQADALAAAARAAYECSSAGCGGLVAEVASAVLALPI